MNDLFEIVHEDPSLLLINKAAGLVCHPTKGDVYSSLISRVRLYLGTTATVHLVNRLDRETSGLVVVAKDDPTAAGLRRQWESGQVRKCYLAVVEGHVGKDQDLIEAPIGPDPLSIVAVKGCVRPDGARSQTWYQRVHHFEIQGNPYSLLRVVPKTGRKHQIRIHLSHIGHPIVGDKIYGWDETCYLAFVEGRLDEPRRARLRLANQALHAASLAWDERGVPRRFSAPLSSELRTFIGAGKPAIDLEASGLVNPAEIAGLDSW